MNDTVYLEARKAAHDLALFGFDVTGGTWVPSRHHILLSRVLEKVEAGKIKRLIVNMPPRHGKSELVSKIFPAWYLGRNPNRNVILAAHTAELAMDFSRGAREYIRELGGFLWGIRLSRESQAVQRWEFQRPLKGGLIAAGVGGPITGRGAHCLPPGTMIESDHGPVPIEELAQNPAGYRVVAYDTEGMRFVYKTLLAVCNRETSELYRVTTARGRVVEATGDHRFLTARGYIRADSLIPGDHLLCAVRKKNDQREEQSPPRSLYVLESDQVAAIEKIDRQATVYDIQVADLHHFFANGICVHNCAIIDDPIKNMAEARSQTYRDHLWEWYRSTLRTRLAPNGAIVVCMTRWHADDLVGRLLSAMEVGGEQWHVLSFPARGREGDPLGRKPGEPLWPEWFSERELAEIERAVGTYVWAALYDQRPMRDKTGALWNERLIEPYRAPAPQHLDRIIVVVDPAGSENPDSSETGICVAGKIGSGINARGYLLEDLSGHYSPLEWGRIAVDAYHRHKADGIYGETNFGGDMVESTIRSVDPNVPFHRIDATRGKMLRAAPVVALYQQGRVHHIRPFPELEIQMCNWDGTGKSPDRLDVVVHAFTELLLKDVPPPKDRSVRGLLAHINP